MDRLIVSKTIYLVDSSAGYVVYKPHNQSKKLNRLKS